MKSQTTSNEVITIKPFNLKNVFYDKDGYVLENKGDIGEHIICVRPTSKKLLPTITSKILNNKKIIINNYGHSGIGYCISFGSINRSISIFKNLIKEKNIKLDDEITIIGLGVIGLTTAITLTYLGFRKIVVIGEKTENICSIQSGALAELTLTFDNNKDKQIMLDMFEETFLTYRKIYNDKAHYLNKHIKEVDFYKDIVSDPGLNNLSKKGIIPPLKKVTLKISGNDNFSIEVFKLKSYLIDTENYMKDLTKRCLELNIKLVKKKIFDFNEINSNIIFNCAGFGGFILNNDTENADPVCGHGVYLTSPDTDDGNVCVVLRSIPGLENTEYNGLFYLMPRTRRLIGGSSIKNDKGDNDKLNKEHITKVVKRALYILNGIKPKF